MKKKRNQDTIEIQAFLDESIVRNFREAINSSRIFNNSDKHKHRYNLTCAVMDRLDSAIFLSIRSRPAHSKSSTHTSKTMADL